MKTPAWLLILLLLYLNSASQVNEHFNKGNIVNSPAWYGKKDSWIVNTNQQLQSNDTVAKSIFYLSTANTLATNTQWEFFTRLNFNTSSVNYADVYLIASDSSFMNTNTTGYFIRIGNTTDEVALYRKDVGGIVTKIIDGRDGLTNTTSNTLMIKVVRNATRQFSLYIDATGTGSNYANEGSFIDTTYTTSSWFGFVVKQSTSSFFRKHYFDDVVIQPYVPDLVPPSVQSIKAVSATALDVLFSEPVDAGSSQFTANYSVNNTDHPSYADRDSLNRALVHLNFTNPFSSHEANMLTIKGVKDLEGNDIIADTQAFSFYSIQLKDMVINEVLFDAKPNGSDYVELYNNTNRAFDISDLYIANRTTSGSLGSLRRLSDTSFLIAPHGYIVLTEDKNDLQRNYLVKDPSNVILLPSLPSFPNEEGTVVLTDNEGTIIDEVHYSSDWHFTLLKETEGVSLERMDPGGNSQEKNNWHSAAATAGYGTPGYENSQLALSKPMEAAIEITPTIFSPDNDGYNDKAAIQYKVAQNGYIANLTIFDAAGRMVRYLVKNDLLGLLGSWNWDGLDEKGQKLPMGTYIIYTELFNLQGKKERFKNTVVLARKSF